MAVRSRCRDPIACHRRSLPARGILWAWRHPPPLGLLLVGMGGARAGACLTASSTRGRAVLGPHGAARDPDARRRAAARPLGASGANAPGPADSVAQNRWKLDKRLASAHQSLHRLDDSRRRDLDVARAGAVPIRSVQRSGAHRTASQLLPLGASVLVVAPP